MNILIRVSGDTLPEIGRTIAERPDILQALLEGKVLILYLDRETGYFRMREDRRIR